jgi:hypothetical protein
MHVVAPVRGAGPAIPSLPRVGLTRLLPQYRTARIDVPLHHAPAAPARNPVAPSGPSIVSSIRRAIATSKRSLNDGPKRDKPNGKPSGVKPAGTLSAAR